MSDFHNLLAEQLQDPEFRQLWGDRNEAILQHTAGSMALSGMDLTEEDRARILYLLEHPDEMDAMLEELIQKHTVAGEDLIDPSTGIKLTPSYHGKECLGNGSWPGYECCCDECGYFLGCFPEYLKED